MKEDTRFDAEREARVTLRRLGARRSDGGVSDEDLFGELRAQGLHPAQAEFVVTRLAARGEIARDPDGAWRQRLVDPEGA